MDSIGVISEMQSLNIQQEVAYAVAAKTLNAARQQGAAALQLLEAAKSVGQPASPPGVGGHIDVNG